MRVVLTLLVRDEADIVAATVEYHLAAGVEFIVATDNGSVDGTDEILAAYRDAGVLELRREPSLDYRQSEWVTGMVRRAAALGADWVINGDADEFYPTPSDRDDADVLIVQRENLVADPAIEGPWPDRLVLRDPLARSPRGTRIGPKAIHRADPEVTVAMGNHAATGPKLTRVVPWDRPVLHVPIRDEQQYRRKLADGVAAFDANPHVGPDVGWHWRQDHAALVAGRLDEVLAERYAERIAAGELVRDTTLRDRLHALLPKALLPDALSAVLTGRPAR